MYETRRNVLINSNPYTIVTIYEEDGTIAEVFSVPVPIEKTGRKEVSSNGKPSI